MTPDTHDDACGAADRAQRTAARPGATLAERIRRCRTSVTARSGERLVVALLLVAVLAGLALTVMESNAFAETPTPAVTEGETERNDFRGPINRTDIEKAQTSFLQGDEFGKTISRVFNVLAILVLLGGLVKGVMKAVGKGGGGGGGGVGPFLKSLIPPILAAILLFNMDFVFDLVIAGGRGIILVLRFVVRTVLGG